MKRVAWWTTLCLFVPVAWGFVSVSPPVAEIVGEEGQRFSGSFTVSNPSQEPLTVLVELQDGWANETGLPTPPMAQWLQLKGPHQFTLSPQSDRHVRYSGRFPGNFQGEAMGMIYFNRMSTNAGAMSIQYRHGIPIYLFSKKTAHTELKGEAPRLSRRSDSPSLWEFSQVLHNTGNAHSRPHGTLTWSDGLEVHVSTDFYHGAPVFPGKDQTFYGAFDSLPAQKGFLTIQWTYRQWSGESQQFTQKYICDTSTDPAIISLIPETPSREKKP